MPSLTTDIVISSPVQQVWELLMDFPRYPEWNPFIKKLEGNLTAGSSLTAVLQPSGQRAMTFKPRVTTYTPPQEFRWLGHFIFPGLLDGEHVFRLEKMGENKTRFVQEEHFHGLLVKLVWNQLNTHTRRGFDEMNLALKNRAER